MIPNCISLSNLPKEFADKSIGHIESCVYEIRAWMQYNFLKLNDKTEFMIIGFCQQLSKVSIPHITIGDSEITPVAEARNLCTIFDSTMSLNSYVSNIVRTASFHIRNIGKIWKYLNSHATEQIVHSVVVSQLDMGNSLLIGLPRTQIERLQRIITCTLSKKTSHITPTCVYYKSCTGKGKYCAQVYGKVALI